MYEDYRLCHNRLPQARLRFISPYQKLWNDKPMVRHFKVFGCVSYVFVPYHLRSKFDKKAIRCIFMGYDNERKAWKCCNPTIGHHYTSRDVIFNEASLWWTSKAITLTNFKEIKKELQQQLEEHSKVNEKESTGEGAPHEDSVEIERGKNDIPNK